MPKKPNRLRERAAQLLEDLDSAFDVGERTDEELIDMIVKAFEEAKPL